MVKYNLSNILLKKIKNQGVKLMEKGEINAVHDDDIVPFLKSIEEYDKVISGQAECLFCGAEITLNNIQSIFPLNNEVKYCCNSEKCYRLLIEGSYV